MSEHPAITLLKEYDALKRKLWIMEQELNRACSDFGRDKLGLAGFGPAHLRQRLSALGQLRGEQDDEA